MGEEEKICYCNFQQLLSEILFEIKTGNVENINDYNHEQLNMILHIAACLSSRIFGVNLKTIKKYMKSISVNIIFDPLISYYDLNFFYHEKIHQYGLKGLSFIINNFLTTEKENNRDKDIHVNWKNVIQEIFMCFGEEYIKKEMGLGIDAFLPTIYKSQNVEKFLKFFAKTFNTIFNGNEKMTDINYSKLIKKYNITENIVMEMLSYCQRNCLKAYFIVEFFLLIVKISETSKNLGMFLTYGGGNKRTNPENFTHCTFKVRKFHIARYFLK